jgi:2-dehydro-3-deoxygluconokinase
MKFPSAKLCIRLDPGEGRIKTARSFRAWEGGGEYTLPAACALLRLKNGRCYLPLPKTRLAICMRIIILPGGVDTSLIKWVKYDGIGQKPQETVLTLPRRGFGIRAQ